MNDEAVRELLVAIYEQAFEDFIKDADVPDKEKLYDWLLNAGRVRFAPFLVKKEIKEKLDEYL